MRLLPWVVAAGVAVAGCGLDADGLDPVEGGTSSSDAMFSPDTDAIGDATAKDASDATLSDSAPKEGDGSSGPDGDGSGGAEAAPEDSAANDAAPSDDAATDAAPEDDANEGGADTGSDSGSNDAESADASDACGAVEICNNGIDDNCNGLVDCADPECNSGWTCTTASIPSGWSLVEYVENARPACATAYATSVDVVEGPSGGAAMCGCNCDVTTPGSCETGSFSVSAGIGVCTIPLATSPGNGGACSPAMPTSTPLAGTKVQVQPVGYTAGSCTPNPTVSVPDAGFGGQGRLCFDTSGSGAGCANGGVCAPTVQGNGFSLCIAHDGTPPCPAGFSTTHNVGTGITDTRGCSACNCGGATATCADAVLTLFTDGGCADDGAALPADAVCHDFNGPTAGPTYVAYEYTATVQGEGCAATPGSPDGGISLTKPRTVCCQ